MAEGVRHVLLDLLQVVRVRALHVDGEVVLRVAEEVEVALDRLLVRSLAQVGGAGLLRAVLAVRVRGPVGVEELGRRLRAVPQRLQEADHRVVAGAVDPGGVEEVLAVAVQLPGLVEEIRILGMDLRGVLGDRDQEPGVVVPVPHDAAEQLVPVRRVLVVLRERDVLGAQLAQVLREAVGEVGLALGMGGRGEVQSQVLLELLDVLEPLLVELRVVVRVRGHVPEELEGALGAECLVEVLGELGDLGVVRQQFVELDELGVRQVPALLGQVCGMAGLLGVEAGVLGSAEVVAVGDVGGEQASQRPVDVVAVVDDVVDLLLPQPAVLPDGLLVVGIVARRVPLPLGGERGGRDLAVSAHLEARRGRLLGRDLR